MCETTATSQSSSQILYSFIVSKNAQNVSILWRLQHILQNGYFPNSDVCALFPFASRESINEKLW